MDQNLIFILGGVIVFTVPLLVFFRPKSNRSAASRPSGPPALPLIPAAPEPAAPEPGPPPLTATVNEMTASSSTLSGALKKTEDSFFGRIKRALGSGNATQILDEIEEILYTSDLGPKTVEKLLAVVKNKLSKSELLDLQKVKSALKSEITAIFEPLHAGQMTAGSSIIDVIRKAPQGPTVIMILGVNGAGKTTTVGKLTAQLAQKNQKVLVAAGDTFRAAAGGQLKVWTERAQNAVSKEGIVEIFWPENVQDPAAVAFDAVSKAKAQNFDFVILDTAGRLHTQSHLMEELKKVKRVMSKVIAEAPHNTWIVLDANSGQNALSQAIEFNRAMELSGVVVTKLDGTAKGGVLIGLVDNLNLPVKLVGLGEKIGDLKVFDHVEYVESILGS